MAIESNIPEISLLKSRVGNVYSRPLSVHSDFVELREQIFRKTKAHISETTLERLWNYSTRGYSTVSRRTLDVLCEYIGTENWTAFLKRLKTESVSESDMFDEVAIHSDDLKEGDRLRIGWGPDRICVIRYLGRARFVADETHNSKLQPGDTFSCLQFQLHEPLFMEHLTRLGGEGGHARYGVGLRNGLTLLQKL